MKVFETRRLLGLSLSLTVGLMGTPLLGAAAKSKPAPETRVVYIYSDDNATKDSFDKFLSQQGVSFRGLRVAGVTGFNFAGTDVIIVGGDTNTDFGNFASDAAAKLKRTQKPILSLHEGGSKLFDLIAPEFGHGASMYMDGTSVRPKTIQDRLWRTPFAFSAEESELFKLYKVTTESLAIWSGQAPANVRPLAVNDYRLPYFPLAAGRSALGQELMLWGYDGGPSAMTVLGRRLFINAVARLALR